MEDELLQKLYLKILFELAEGQQGREALLSQEAYRDFYGDIPAITAKEIDIRDSIDEMIWAYARKHPMPHRTGEQALLFFDRFVFAKKFLARLREELIAKDQLNETLLMTWVLIDCWKDYGVPMWQTFLQDAPEDWN